ncbi:unnamed protein product [Psylliodes chrysocephalus]|uniref:Nuclear migration protein nudC n=1 Tax=Psylliodes chrysocephalus TaxID=3402493 RepID=A0A9P0C7L8_9CUCU|nr:unnamed protein product [Psylliodes chrysocephala]
MSDNKHDDMLFEMLKECKTLPNFLEEVFGFLQRRTDFYHVAKEPNSPVGLPEGLVEKLVRHTFYKFKPVGSEIIRKNQINITKKAITEISEVISEIKDEREEFSFSKSECYNGSVFENYCWSQTVTDIDIIVKIPKNCTTKHIDVKILPSNVHVTLESGEVLLKGDLCKKCKANDAVWSLDGQKLLIHLDKCQEMWWNCLVQSEPVIDISKIDCSRPYEELPEEAQAKIEELQWNQERKKLGLPTSDELAMHETLKKAWHADGSPFNGPFDPTRVKFN